MADETAPDYVRTYQDFWKPIIEPNTAAHHVIAAVDERIDEACEDARREVREEFADNQDERDQLDAAIAGLKEVFESAGNALAGAPDDWSETRGKSWMWGLFCGWDCEQAHEHDPDTDPTCIFALDEIAAKHGWSPELIARLRQLRSTVAAVEQPADSKET